MFVLTIGLSVISVGMSQEVSALSSLVGKWSFNEAAGPIAHDTSGNNHNGTILGATHLPATDCKFFRCLGFDGKDDSVSIGSLGISTDKQPFSIVAWINPDLSTINDGSVRSIVQEGSTPNNSGNGKFYVSFSVTSSHGPGKIAIDIGATQNYAVIKYTKNEIPGGQWSFVAVTYDGSRTADGIKVYVNGIERQTTTTPGSGFNGTAIPRDQWSIGAQVHGFNPFAGSIDSVKVLSCALDTKEVMQEFHGFNIMQC